MLEACKAAARSRHLDYNRYVERLIVEGTTGARAAGMAAAQRLIDEHGAFLDGLEQQLDAPTPVRSRAPPGDLARRRVLDPRGSRAGRRRDPACDDYGVPIAAVARHRGELLDTPLYDGPFARAAALVHTLGRCRWLERSNLTVACAAAVMYLEAGNILVSPTREQLTALAHELNDPRCTTARIASFLRTWKP